MPNWCDNRLYVEGSREDIAALIQAVNEGCMLDFMCPEPEHEKDVEGEAPNWYSWRIRHWGTKWEVSAEVVSAGEDWANIVFDSAWSPPISAIGTWFDCDSENRSFNLRFIEWDMAFCGEANSDGLVQSFDIPLTVEEAKESIPEELIEEFEILGVIAQYEYE